MSCYKPAPTERVVSSNRQIADGIWEMVLQWDGCVVPPGTFVMVQPATITSMPLGRPISVADVAEDGSTLTIIYRVVGSGTAALTKVAAEGRVTVLGPLGKGFPVSTDTGSCGSRVEDGAMPPAETPAALSQATAITAEATTMTAQAAGTLSHSQPHALLIGGGVGIPPLYFLGRTLVNQGWRVTFHLGLRGAHEVFWRDRFSALGDVHFATDDGTAGVHGTVAQIGFDADAPLPSAVHACGPLPMLRYVQNHWGPICPTYVSVEQRMACGVGACYACVIPDAQNPDHQHRICYDGPVFAAQEVVL